MFHIVINDLGDRPQNMLIKSGGHTKLRSTESTLEGRIKIQNYSDKLHLCPQKGKKTQKTLLFNRLMCKMLTWSGITSYKTQNEEQL